MRKLLLIDGHSLIHRAYHAYPKTLATGKGELTNAVYGFTNILLSAINELAPTHAAVAFDLPKPTFREKMFVGYKQSRVKPDDELIAQIPRIKEVVEGLNVPIFEVEGFEADDVIGTLAQQAVSENSEYSESRNVRKSEDQKSGTSGFPTLRQSDLSGSPSFPSVPKNTQVIILTSDRDLMQLISGDRVVVQLPVRGKREEGRRKREGDLWNETGFIQEWGFKPELLPDYKALAGDQSDDIPGVRGIGEKTAKNLVSTFGSINDIYAAFGLSPGQVQSSKFKVQSYSPKFKVTASLVQKLASDQESAQLSKKLATIDTAVPIKLNWQQTEIHQYDKEKILKLFEKLQFKSLIRKLPNDSFEQSVQEVLF